MDAWTVTLDTPDGIGQVDLIASSPDVAGRRAQWSMIAAGWGDVGEVTVLDVSPCTDWND